MSKREELEAARAKKLEERAKLEDEQFVKDFEAREKLEEQYPVTATVKVSRYVQGLPTFVVLRAPEPGEYKAYKEKIHKSASFKDGGAKMRAAATDDLAKAVWVYPSEQADREAMLATFTGLLSPIFMAASSLAEGAEADEGKG